MPARDIYQLYSTSDENNIRRDMERHRQQAEDFGQSHMPVVHLDNSRGKIAGGEDEYVSGDEIDWIEHEKQIRKKD